MLDTLPTAIKVYLSELNVSFSENKIKKRNGKTEKFDIFKVFSAIKKSFGSDECAYTYANVTYDVAHDLLHLNDYKKDLIFNIERVQDIVEIILMRNYPTVAKKYIVYREQRTKAREDKKAFDVASIINGYIDVLDWRVKENSNIGYSIGALILHNSGAMSSHYWLDKIYSKEVKEAHITGAVHIHDLSMLTGYCMGLSLRKLVEEGIPGLNRNLASHPAKHLSTIVNQMTNFLGIHQNEVAGAVAFSSVDTWLAPFIRYEGLEYERVKQNLQSLIFGLNTPSRWGCVLPDTEVLTPRGWETFDTLKEGNDIYCWESGNLVIGQVNKVVIKEYDGEVYSFQNKHYGYEQEVTANHRCISTHYSSTKLTPEGEILTANKISKYNYLPLKINADLPDNPNISDDEIEISARVYCDGNLEYRQLKTMKGLHKVSYYKSPRREDLDKISNLFARWGLVWSEKVKKSSFRNSEVKYWTFFGESARKILTLVEDKYNISDKFLSLGSRQARLFIETWAKSDGDKNALRLQYDTEEIGDKLQHIALIAGYTSFKFSKTKVSYLNKRGKPGTINYVKLRQVDSVGYKQKEVSYYKGMVWCPSTTHGTAIFRKEGNIFISGNSQAPFTNFTFDLKPPTDLRDKPVVIGGKWWKKDGSLVECNSVAFDDEGVWKYQDFQEEMDMLNSAFLELMYNGDAEGRPFSYPIPTYNITKDFDWESPVSTALFKMAGKYGLPYFQNFLNSDLDPSAVRSMCCRLSLDKSVLLKRGGGLFGADEFTGSLGVSTLNLPQIGYLLKKEFEGTEVLNWEKDYSQLLEKFWQKVLEQMEIARKGLLLKKKTIERFTEMGLYPYTQHHIKHWNNHFLTIGLVGMNEALLNLMGRDITEPTAREIGLEILSRMREKIIQYQLDDDADGKNNLWNLEATPAEGVSHRLAKIDKKKYPDIITAGEGDEVYYTNSTIPPVNYTEDIFEVLDHQDEFQTKYTGGTVLHLFLGESIDADAAKLIVKKVCENYHLPYVSLTPTYSVCKTHGHIPGKHPQCPKCGQECDVYSRVVGYYRPVKGWNKGKQQEFKERVVYIAECAKE